MACCAWIRMKSHYGVIVMLFVWQTALSLKQTEFLRDSICDVDTRESLNCTVRMGSRSDIECLVTCSKDDTCIGASVDSLGICFHHHECPELTECTTLESDHNYKHKTKKCDNNGIWNPVNKSCSCNYQWTGVKCEVSLQPVLVNSCHDLLQLGYPSGEHVVMMKLGSNFPAAEAVCSLDNDSSLSSVFLIRNEGTHDFNMTWNSYQNGFFYDINNLWLGLDYWNRLSEAGYQELNVTLHHDTAPYSSKSYVTSIGISVENASDNFKLKWNPSGSLVYNDEMIPLAECLARAISFPFSTFDMDNDGNEAVNCASMHGSAWWYTYDCAQYQFCNLLGWSWRLNDSSILSYQRMQINYAYTGLTKGHVDRVDVSLRN